MAPFLLLSMLAVVNLLSTINVLAVNASTTVSPPFAAVALEAWSNREIAALLRDPTHYAPSWGKTGIAFSVTYYVRNARMAATYHADPEQDDAVRRLFQMEMDIFSAFRSWFDHRHDDAAWTRWAETVGTVFNDDLKAFLERLASDPMSTEMALPRGGGAAGTLGAVPHSVVFEGERPFVALSDEEGFPLIGFGSWTLTDDECTESVLLALDAGYRLIDSSENYRNERAIGEALRRSDVDRAELFLSSKLSFDENYGEKVTTAAFSKSLDNLGVDYLDLYMVHGAIGDKARLKAAWLEMEELVRLNKIRFLGVSNFGPSDMDYLMDFATIKPRFVQNKFDPFTQGMCSRIAPRVERARFCAF